MARRVRAWNGRARAPPARADSTGTFTLRQVLGYPFVATIASSDGANAIAWALDERGVRNVWIARGPDYRAVKLTSNTADDGQEIANLLVSRDGRTVVYTRGGDHDANWSESLDPDPAANPVQQFVQVWSIVPADGTSAPKLLGNGDSPAISPDGKTVAFVRDGAVWSAPADGSSAAKQLFFDRGQASDLQWSPSGDALAFVSGRGDHGFIGDLHERADADPLHGSVDRQRLRCRAGRPTERASRFRAYRATAGRLKIS